MQLKTVQWNIGGGKIRNSSSTADDPSSYAKDGMDYIIHMLVDSKPDIITLQETHTKDNYSQVAMIAKALNYKYWVNDEYADSHVSDGYRLGQGIVSRFPISNHHFELFFNPQFQAKWEDGSMAISHDKGLSTCSVDVEGQAICVMTLHAIPFRAFGVDPLSDVAAEVRKDMQEKLQSNESQILVQGDFNFNEKSLKKLLPGVFDNGMEETIQDAPTTPKGRFYDHVLYKGLRLGDNSVDNSVLTDRYPVTSIFNID